MRIDKYCTCGNELHVEVNRRKSQQCQIVWFTTHHGSGHEPTDAAGARAARTGWAIPDASKREGRS